MAVMAFRVITTLLLAAIRSSNADMYLNSPRGSNNKLREQSNNVQNANRLFDSQNNAASGYQIGDDCKPACKDENNNYDVTVEGATKGTMKFYQGSELYIEWHHQHGCGVGHPNLRCQIVNESPHRQFLSIFYHVQPYCMYNLLYNRITNKT